MNQIRDWLYVGKYRDTTDGALLSSRRIGAMLQLAAPITMGDVASCYLAVEDGEALPHDLLAQGVAWVRGQRQALGAGERPAVLIACGAGISRSVTFTMAALHEEEGLSLLDAYRTIRQSHPDAMPHPALLKSLNDYYRDMPTFEELFHGIHRVDRDLRR